MAKCGKNAVNPVNVSRPVFQATIPIRLHGSGCWVMGVWCWWKIYLASFLKKSASFFEFIWQVNSEKLAVIRNDSIDFVERFHWFRSTNPLILLNDSNGFVLSFSRFCRPYLSSLSPAIDGFRLWIFLLTLPHPLTASPPNHSLTP